MAGASLLALSMAACGSEKSAAPTSTGVKPSTTVDSALAAMVPAAIKADGKIIVGTDSTYAPSEFLDTDGKTVIGFDVDLFNAVAAKLGLKTEWESADVRRDHPGVQSGKYEVGVSSFTINADREKQSTWSATSPPAPSGRRRPAARRPEQRLRQEDRGADRHRPGRRHHRPVEEVHRRRQAGDHHRPVPGAGATPPPPWSAARTTRCSPTRRSCAYAVKQTNGQLALLGDIYDSAPYGYVV